jgi:hypothetical protein
MAMSDYLWDKSGRDPEVESLERLFAPASLKGAPRPRVRPLFWFAGAAAAALFAFGAIQSLQRTVDQGPWVVRQDGRRELDMGRYGRVVAEPGARVRVIRMDDTLHKLRLDAGTLHASITRDARPRLFQVETPATTCIDLGCRYTLTVLPSGVSEVQVQSGRVAFHDGRREVFIPEGAGCRAAPGRAPSTPIREDAAPALRMAVESFDAAPRGGRAREAKAACTLIGRREDGLVAWHLLQDAEPAVVTAAREALHRLTRMPECGMAAPEAVAGDELRAWRDVLFPELKNWD